jgi:hypothetical protein
MMLATSYERNYYWYMCGFAWLGLDVPLSLSCVGPFLHWISIGCAEHVHEGVHIEISKGWQKYYAISLLWYGLRCMECLYFCKQSN